MKKNVMKVMALLLAVCLSFTLAACGGTDGGSSSQGSTASTGSAESTTGTANTGGTLSGNLTMAGSTSMEKLANSLAEAFMEQHNGVTVSPEFTGSSAGIESMLTGSVNIGNASRNLKDSEIESGAVENIVAIDGIAVIVNPGSTVTALTKDQLVAIYKGEVANWSDLGGNDEPIVVVGREAGSGTRGAFEELLDVEDACNYALELDSTGTVVAKVASTPGAIGYVSLDMVDNTVVSVELDGVAATAENIKAGEYLLSRPFVMATNGAITEQDELVQAFFAYIYSAEGSTLIESIGLITVD